jgi:hypothetical protein
MAHYKPSALFEQFRGKIGNSVFTANRAGNNLRNYVVPSNPQTANQVRIRDLFSIIASNWFNLSASERANWSAFANAGYIPLNKSINTLGFTGRQAYSANAICVDYANSIITQQDLLNMTNLDFAGEDLSAETFLGPVMAQNPPSLWAPSSNFVINGDASVLEDFDVIQNQLQGGGMVVDISMNFDVLTNDAGAVTIKNGGRDVGFAIYLSNALKANGQSVVSPFQKKYIVSPIFKGGTSAGTGNSLYVIFNMTVDNLQWSFLTGWYYVTLVMYDEAGQQFPLMSKYLEMTVV